MKTALITGATSGIGRSTAIKFASEGINLIICGRRTDRLEKLKKELSVETSVHILSFDVRNREEVLQKIADQNPLAKSGMILERKQ